MAPGRRPAASSWAAALALGAAVAPSAYSISPATPTTPERVHIDGAGSRYRVVSSEHGRLGVDGTIRGAGGTSYMTAARTAGADALRTWGADALPEVVPEAEAQGLRISAGLWLPHSPSFYENCTDLEADPRWRSELERYLTAVRQYKNSSAILWWTVGNEMELEVDVFAGNDCVWKRVEWAVKAVQAEDPNHPVGTVLAGCLEPKVRAMNELCPSLDFFGVNAYGDAALEVGPDLRAWGWTRPYALMEFGPSGHWVSPTTEWGAYIEETTTEKVVRYSATCNMCFEDERCIGAFAFVWGWKWEKTGTWYNLFNEWEAVTSNTTGVACPNCESEVMASLEKCWSGTARASLPPSIHGVEVDGEALHDMSFVAPWKAAVSLKVNASHPQGEDVVALWAVTEEVVSKAIGGAHEETNPLLTGVWSQDDELATSTGVSVSLNTSDLKVGGEYRLYVFLRQDPASCNGTCRHQEATASLPFYVCHAAQRNERCYSHVSYALETGIKTHPQTYPGVTASSSFEEVQALLHQKGEGECPAPCGLRDWCHTSVPGEECYGAARWAMEHGVKESPKQYPASLKAEDATIEMFQQHLYKNEFGLCPKPCQRGAGQMPGKDDDPTSIASMRATAGIGVFAMLLAGALLHPMV